MKFSDQPPLRRLDPAQALTGAPMPLYEVRARDLPEPRGLGEIYQENGRTLRVELTYGNPMVRSVLRLAFVHTSFPRHSPDPVHLMEKLHRQYDLGPLGTIDRHREQITVDEQVVNAESLSSDRVWVLECTVQNAVITVGGIGWHPEGRWQLTQLTDLSPLLTGREEYLRKLSEEGGE